MIESSKAVEEMLNLQNQKMNFVENILDKDNM